MTAAAVEPDDDEGGELVTAWFQHAAAVEGKLENLSRIMAATAEQVAQQGDPSRYPDPFALAAMQNAVRAWGGGQTEDGRVIATEELLGLADRFEAWLRKPRGETA